VFYGPRPPSEAKPRATTAVEESQNTLLSRGEAGYSSTGFVAVFEILESL
jgi:hypothetical protein